MIIKNSIFFVFFEILNKAVPFMLLPILTRYLTPDDYGIIASFTALISFIAIFVGLSGHGAIDSNFFRLEKSKLGIYIANVLIVLLFTTFITLLIILFFHERIESKLILSFEWQILATFVVFAQFVTLINLSLWVIEQKPLPYGIYQFLQTVTISLISITLIIGFSYDWQGQAIAMIIGTLVFSFVSLILLYKRGYFNLKIHKEYMKDFLKFGLPMIPHQLGGWLRSQGDKIIIISLLGTSATGLFAVGFQIGVIMSVLINSLTKALYPILFRYLAQNLRIEDKNKLILFSYGLFFGIIFLGIVLIFLLRLLYPYLVGSEFQDSLYLTQLIVISFIFEGLYVCVVGYLFYFKQTAKLAKMTFSISIVHIIMSFILIKYFGVIGAGYALIISGLVQFVLIWHLSNKIYPMPWFSFWRKNEI